VARAHSENAFGNPEDLQDYIRKLEEPERDVWQKPSEVLRVLELRPDHVVGEIGAGSGYFTVRMAPAVMHVFAADADARLVEILRERVAAAAFRNVTPVLALADDPFLPSGRCDLILTVNAYHHFPEPAAYLRRVARALRRGGRIAIIDDQEKTERDRMIRDAKAAALRVAAEHLFLPQQHFLVFA
jgi:SAM-dependent methyltransferase